MKSFIKKLFKVYMVQFVLKMELLKIQNLIFSFVKYLDFLKQQFLFNRKIESFKYF